MDTGPHPCDSTQAARPETEPERQRRLAWEAETIAAADAEIEAGLFVEEAEVDAWIDSLGTDHGLPVPQPRR
jgi:predicted transcriptional regulator